ncbi:MAG: hypothetical protein ACRDTJ_27590, partial [Pseudonocardiaceae bacterium]
LVTLLAWADHLNVAPLKPNRFFEAKAAGRLARVETDKRRTLSFSPFWPGRILSVVTTLLSVVAAAIVVSIDWRVLLLPFGWWSPLLSLAAAVVSFGIVFGRKGAWFGNYLYGIANVKNMAHFAIIIDPEPALILCFFGGPLTYAVAITPLAAWSVPGYLAVAILGPVVLFYSSILGLFARTTRFYLYRPNPYIDMYHDPSSRYWLRTGISKTLIVEPAETNLLSTH